MLEIAKELAIHRGRQKVKPKDILLTINLLRKPYNEVERKEIVRVVMQLQKVSLF